MNTELILKSDVLDLLFQNRNKAYGAYQLRKLYPSRLKTSLLFVFFGAAAISAFTFLPDKKGITDVIRTETVTFGSVPPTVPEPPKPKQPSANKLPAVKKFIPNFIVVPNTDSTEKFEDLNKYAIGSNTVVNITGIADDGKDGATESGSNTKLPEPPAAPEPEKIGPVDNPDIQASFPGGQKELIRFLERNLRSPNDIDEGQTIQVQVKFVVDFDGDLQSFEVVKDGGDAFNKEVLRVLKKMPKWNPGKNGGQNIPVYYTIPVKFTSNE